MVIPSAIAGLTLGIANAAFFVANASLSQAIAFPIVSCAPGMLGALLGVTVYKEIKGTRNYFMLTIACILTVIGTFFSGLSF